MKTSACHRTYVSESVRHAAIPLRETVGVRRPVQIVVETIHPIEWGAVGGQPAQAAAAVKAVACDLGEVRLIVHEERDRSGTKPHEA
jgi:hypothetical protein